MAREAQDFFAGDDADQVRRLSFFFVVNVFINCIGTQPPSIQTLRYMNPGRLNKLHERVRIRIKCQL